MFYHAAREGLVDPARSVQIGLRTHNDDLMGFNVLDAPWVHEHGVQAAASEVRRIVGGHKAYLTFDIDCLDPAFAPGTGTPVSGGLSSAQALAILKGLAGIDSPAWTSSRSRRPTTWATSRRWRPRISRTNGWRCMPRARNQGDVHLDSR